jgi:two-component system OmpR family response regulator
MAETKTKILVVDDDGRLRDLLNRYLSEQGYTVRTVSDAAEMNRQLARERYDLMILDLMLPGEDGLSICRRLRGGGETMPIIMLTAKGDEVDRIVGLELGADDYLAKPFNPRELLARIKAVLRRGGAAAAPAGAAPAASPGRRVLEFAGWRFDLAQRSLQSPGGETLPLSGGEFELLVAFAQHPRRVLTRDYLLDLARGRSAMPFDRTIDVQVSRLRRKIEANPADPGLIKTVRGGGYIFTPAVTTIDSDD